MKWSYVYISSSINIRTSPTRTFTTQSAVHVRARVCMCVFAWAHPNAYERACAYMCTSARKYV